MKLNSTLLKVSLLTLVAMMLPDHATANTAAPVLHDDGRFAGFDAREYVARNHARLAPRAEAISHWAGFYRLNPIFLAHILDHQYAHRVPAIHEVKWAAEQLSRDFAGGLEEPESLQLLADQVARAAGIDTTAAGKVLRSSAEQTAKSGYSISMVEASDTPPALDLPFARPQAWQFNGAHTWSGADNDSPMSSIDFTRSWSIDWGDDTATDWISASHDGVVSVFSSCYVQVQHDSGWATQYYHLDNVQVEPGQRVRAGDLIGIYSSNEEQALCTGGSSTGPHLHFALLKDGSYTGLQDIELSGYRIHPGDYSYDSNRDRMWLEKRGQRYFAFDEPIAIEEGDNTIDYRYNGMWFSPASNGHGLNVEITEFPVEGGTRKVVFVVIYTYDDSGQANFYAGNAEYERWRSDEALLIDMLQTDGGDFTNLAPIDFDNPEQARVAGQAEVGFLDCERAWLELNLEERDTGQAVEHAIELVKLIGTPSHVCEAARVPVPGNGALD